MHVHDQSHSHAHSHPSGVLPVCAVEVMQDGRPAQPIPAVSSLCSKGVGWNGIALEAFADVPACSIPEHDHPTHFLNLLTSKEPVKAQWTTDGRSHTAVNDTGTIYLLPRGSRDRLAWSGPSSRIVVIIEPRFLANALEQTSHRGDVQLQSNWGLHDPHIASLMVELYSDVRDGSPAGRLYGESLGTALAVYLVRRYAINPVGLAMPRNGMSAYRLKRVLDFINDNLGEDLSLSELAAAAGLGPHHFSQLFRQSVGATPHQYVTRQRIERAKRLLQDPEFTMLDVALATGFADQTHFAKVFRKLTNVTPSKYRSGL